ncbi:PepSY domain-containing protein [Shewanella psychrophila]|nr:PepSY domain-containing protein [Shewanella psychrophila]
MKLILAIVFYVGFISSVFSAERIEINDSIFKIKESMSIMSLLNLNDDYSFISTLALEVDGVKVNRHQEFYKSIPVYAAHVVSKQAIGSNIVRISGGYIQGIEQDLISTDPFLTGSAAFDIALRHLGIVDDTNAIIENKHNKLTIYIDSDLTAYLAYQISFFTDITGPSRPFFYINADTGEVLDNWDGLTHITTSCAIDENLDMKILRSRTLAVLNAFFEESFNYYPVLLEATRNYNDDNNEDSRVNYEKSRIRYAVILERYSKAHKCAVKVME